MRSRVVLGVWLGLLALGLIAGRSSTVGQPTWLHLTRIADVAGLDTANRPAHVAPCIPQVTIEEINVAAGTSARHACYPDPERDFQLTRFVVTVLQHITGATEDCELVLEADNDGTQESGDEIASSAIQIGDGNVDGVNCGAEISAIGDTCALDLDTSDAVTLVKAGGWFTVNVNDGTNGGGDCTVIDTVQLTVWGYYP